MFTICTVYLAMSFNVYKLDPVKPETSDQPDRETCALTCHYL